MDYKHLVAWQAAADTHPQRHQSIEVAQLMPASAASLLLPLILLGTDSRSFASTRPALLLSTAGAAALLSTAGAAAFLRLSWRHTVEHAGLPTWLQQRACIVHNSTSVNPTTEATHHRLPVP